MATVSAVVSAWNEEKNIKRCLTSVRWANEIVLVDNLSTDNTVTLAKQYTSKIYRKPNNLMLNVNKNFGFSRATSEWILSLDADEEIPAELVREIRSVVTSSDIVGFWIPRKNIIFGKWVQHGLWWPDKQLRLFRHGQGRFPCKRVHEYLEVDGPTASLKEPYIHYNYQTISQFLRKMDSIYTENEVRNLVATKYPWAWYDALRFPVSDFVKIYFAQEGYKDGLHGLVLSLLQSFYSFVVFAKLWEYHQFIDHDLPLAGIDNELRRQIKEVRYWMGDAKFRNTSSVIKRLWYRIIRRYATIAQ